MTKDIRKIDTLKNWDKNPRGVDQKDFDRLKSQLEKYGQYKPLLINKDGVVLGGNMRLKAMIDMGIKDVWVSEVDATTEQRMVEYALSDNDRIGYYEDQALAELIASVPDIDLTEFKIDLGKPVDLKQLLQQLGVDSYGDDFTLPDGDKPGFQQITFTLADEQAEFIKNCMADAKNLNLETYDNENNNGNCIYWICKQWQQSKT